MASFSCCRAESASVPIADVLGEDGPVFRQNLHPDVIHFLDAEYDSAKSVNNWSDELASISFELEGISDAIQRDIGRDDVSAVNPALWICVDEIPDFVEFILETIENFA